MCGRHAHCSRRIFPTINSPSSPARCSTRGRRRCRMKMPPGRFRPPVSNCCPEAGFQQYEVSAYAQRGRRCRHNLNYWLFGDYIGVGAGAHGKISFAEPRRILRTVKPKQPREYQQQIRQAGGIEAVGDSTWVAPADVPFEFMLNALRLNDGFQVSEYENRTGLPMSALGERLAAAAGKGLMTAKTGGWQPTELGLRFLNDLQGSFLG